MAEAVEEEEGPLIVEMVTLHLSGGFKRAISERQFISYFNQMR